MDDLITKVKSSKAFGWLATFALVLGTLWQAYNYTNNFYEEARPNKTFLEKTQVNAVAANNLVYIYIDVPANVDYPVSLAVYLQDSPVYYHKFAEVPRGSFSVSIPFPIEAYGQTLLDLDLIWSIETWTSFIEENNVYVGLDVEVSNG